jgi:hypothetical protein
MVVGEEQPTDFKAEIMDFWPVTAEWAATFERAMGTELKNRATAKAVRPLLENLMRDPIATGPNAWKSDLTSRLATATQVIHDADLKDMRKDLDVSVIPGADFDPDFPSEVTAMVRNRSAYRYEGTLEKPDGRRHSFTVEPRGTFSTKATVQRIAKGELKAVILDLTAPSDRVFVDAAPAQVPAAPGKKAPAKRKS